MLAMVPYYFVGLIVYLDGHDSGGSNGKALNTLGLKSKINRGLAIIAVCSAGPLDHRRLKMKEPLPMTNKRA
jgi:hypothetical protein